MREKRRIILEVKELRKEYPGPVHALAGVSFTVREGDFVAIVGRSGSGKSTLMHMIGLMDVPTSGSIFLLGKEVGKLSEEEKTRYRAKYIGFIFQAFNLLPELDALENAAIPAMLTGLSKKEAEKRAILLFEKLGMSHRLRHDVTKLSGGEKQRVAIARALINEPALLLGDEPTGNLDTKTRDEIIDLLRKLNKEGKTIVIVTHDMDVAKRAKHIIWLQDGKIVGEKKWK